MAQLNATACTITELAMEIRMLDEEPAASAGALSTQRAHLTINATCELTLLMVPLFLLCIVHRVVIARFIGT